MSPEAQDQADSVPPRAALVLTALLLGAVVANINLSIANVALPDIGRELGASQAQLTNIATGFTLALASTVLYLGAIADVYGRKLMFLLGAALSVPTALLAAYAPNPTVLAGARFLGGLAAAMLFPTTLSLISALFSGGARTRAVALWSGVGGGSAVLGTLLGGILLARLWWGSVFLVTAPIAVIVLLLGIWVLPSKAGEAATAVDHAGGVLSFVAVASLVLGLETLANGLSATLMSMLLVAVAAGLLFFRRQRRAPRPLIDMAETRPRTFWVSALAGTIGFGCLIGSMFIGQQFTQNVLHYTPLDAALVTLPAGLLMILASFPAATLIAKKGGRVTMSLGLCGFLAGFAIMLLLWHPGASVLVIVSAYGFAGFGAGLTMASASHSLMASLPIARGGMGSAFLDLTRDFGGAIMNAIMGTVLAVFYAASLMARFRELPPAEASSISQSVGREMTSSYAGAEQVASGYPDHAQAIIQAASQAFTEGKSAALAVALVLSGLALVLLLVKYPRRADEEAFFAEVEANDPQRPSASPGDAKPA
ncbi:MAG: MFS transporter [Candidatus Nanopelagicales bacterium]|nr:MFS transporter [Candidatus Nanopelagicales bacterium]MDZ4248684.1 MFS transporter [Candidatus Nanopelagicales bacterium]